MLPEELAAYLIKEKRDNPEVKVVIRADRNVPYSYISPVLVACGQAAIKSVDFSKTRERN